MNREKIANLFNGAEETIIYSCLEGAMGILAADEDPQSAYAAAGRFLLLCGQARRSADRKGVELSFGIRFCPAGKGVVRNSRKGPGRKGGTPFSLCRKKEGNVFDSEKLNGFIEALPAQYCLKLIDEEIYERLGSKEWSKYLCGAFSSYEEYRAKGLG